jgi:hypothetical protein
MAEILGLTGDEGLTQVLNGSAEPRAALQQFGGTGRLRVMVAGPPVPNPGTLLGSKAMGELLSTLLDSNDLVVLDTPPLLSVADTSRLLPLTDGAVVCARWGVVHAKELAKARGALARVGARALGVVVTFVPRSAAPKVGNGAAHRQNGHPTTTAKPERLWRRAWRRHRPEPGVDSAAVGRPRRADAAPDRAEEKAAAISGASPSTPGVSTHPRMPAPLPMPMPTSENSPRDDG